MWWAKTFAPFLAFILLIQFSNSILINQTIDDGLGDLQTGLKVQYLPLMDDSGPVWKSHDTCGDTCFINPDSTRAHDNTWNSATCSGSDTVTATLSFRGTAIYIYFIVASIPRPDETIGADCDFWVDERFVGSYIQTPAVGVFEYNTLVYANDSLSDTFHTFVIQARNNSFLIFDYAEYTTDVEVTVPPSPISMFLGLTSDASIRSISSTISASSTSSTSSASGARSTTSTSGAINTGGIINTSGTINTGGITNTMSTSGATSPTAAPTRSPTHTGTIAGGTIAGIAGIALIALGVILCRRRTISSDAPTISGTQLRKTRRGHVSPFILAGAPPIFSIPPSKMRSEYISPFASQEEAGLERRTFNLPRKIATPGGHGGPSTQGFMGDLMARRRWKRWRLKFNERVRKDLLPRSAARPIPVLVGSPSSNVFE